MDNRVDGIALIECVPTTEEPTQEFDRVKADNPFNVIYEEAEESASKEGTEVNGAEVAKALYDASVMTLTIKQVAKLTGLVPFTVRSRTHRGLWSKTYDGGGRIQIPTLEVVNYFTTKRGSKNWRQYIVYMTAEQAEQYKLENPNCQIRPRNLRKGEKNG